MDKIRIIALEGEPKRAARLKQIIEETGQFELVLSKSARKLMALMDGQGEVQLVITNTRVVQDERDGAKFIRALYLKYQNFKNPLPPIIVCSSDQRGDIVQRYAFRFSELPLIFYVLFKDEELVKEGGKLLEVIEKSLAKRRELEESDPENKTAVVKKKLKGLLKKTIAVPALPDVAVRVQDAMKDPEIAFKKLAEIINTDMTMAANVIKLANSPQFGVSGKIGSIEDACKQVGMNAIANTVMAAKVFDALEELPADFDIKRLRRHCYAVATIARIVGRRCHALRKVSAQIQFSGTMFAAGLLHDIGKVLMTQYFTEECQRIAAVIEEQGLTMAVAENRVVGVSHADAGLYAGMEWNFPVMMVNVIGRHHWSLERILPRLKTRQGRLAQRVIRIANAASYELGFGMQRSDHSPPVFDPAFFDKTGLGKEEFDKWTKEIKDDIAYTFEVMGKV